ncbi:DUF2169 domain-containing protein [Sorangium sp. So ce1151]|uniref:DUF2169 family type VI secretion system accessory protein n=1 Tax=Sorangium sp. So ce1151 TaxID=3133332 RepID=UPI003F623CEC
MDIVSLCPLCASGFAWQAHTGAHALTVIVKATFVLQPGESALAPQQEPLCEKERTFNDDPRRSVRVPSDRAPYKPRAEVMLVGHAYAPRREPVRTLVARMVVGEIDKSIEVWCDRGFRLHDGQLLEGQRFVKAPIGWERAAGGPDTNNPVGLPFDTAPNSYGMVAVPSVQPVGTYVSQRADRFAPVGLGPIAARWPARMQKLGRYANGFQDPGWEQWKIPADFDPRYFQSAPLDQQVKEIRSNERIVLENLHPEHARLVTTLPGLRPRAIADRATGEREEVRLVADTLWIDSDRGLCCVVWRGRIGLRHAREAGRIAVWVDGLPMVAPDDRQRPAHDEEPDPTRTIIALAAKEDGPALPFVYGTSKLAEAGQRSLAAELTADASDGTGTTVASVANPDAKALPFRPAADEPEGLAETIPPMPGARVTPAPFMPAIPPLQPVRFEEDEPSIGIAAPSEVKAPKIKMDKPEQQRIEPVPPPMIGPLATAEMGERVQEKEAKERGDKEPSTLRKAFAKEEATKNFRPEDFPLERCAALTASIASHKADKRLILEREELTEQEWSAIETHWANAVTEDTKRGRRALLDRFDHAYLEQLEKERGVFKVEEYARLTVARELGTLNEVLKELQLPRGAVMRVERVWMTKLAADTSKADEVQSAIDRARGD